MKITKNIFILSTVFGLAVATTSCTTTERNTATGAGIGAVAGALIADDDAGKGAAIGALAGAGGGYIYGKNKENKRGY